MSWSKRYTPPSSGGGLFFKLGDGEAVDFVVYDDPHEQVQKWTDGKSEPCDRSDPDAKVSIILPVFVVSKREKGAKTANPINEVKVLRLTPTTFGSLGECIDEPDVGGLGQVYRLRRVGTGLETKYAVTRVAEATVEQRRGADAGAWPDLAKWGTPLAPVPKGERVEKEVPDDDIPF